MRSGAGVARSHKESTEVSGNLTYTVNYEALDT